jgi:alkanesulfonate monooxygenase SsuD/methylene tetrahydromethanopterin reductase-like flavin-dependent oxidoreductase (luciferase family)
LAPGGRPDDYDVSGVDFDSRGRTFDRQLAELAKFWEGEVVGPDPVNGKRPTLLIGGSSDRAFQRAVEHGDGWTMGGGTPDALSGGLAKLHQAWEQGGRNGRPRAVALFYFVLGDDSEEVAQRSLGDYYSFLGNYAERVVQSAAKDRDTINQYLSGFEQAGADEVICFPASSDPSQVELLADAVAL